MVKGLEDMTYEKLRYLFVHPGREQGVTSLLSIIPSRGMSGVGSAYYLSVERLQDEKELLKAVSGKAQIGNWEINFFTKSTKSQTLDQAH